MRGAEFGVRLPARSAPFSWQAEGAPQRVLVADDHIGGADAVAMVLRLAGHEVRVVHRGQDALETAAAFRPAVVFLDIAMPGMDGYEAASRLRQTPGLEHTRVVAITGYGREADRQRARDAGFDEFLLKPVLPENVCAAALRKPPPHPSKQARLTDS